MQTQWRRAGMTGVPSGLDYAVADWSVNSGPARAVKELQKLVKVTPDGVMGAKTLAAVEARCAETGFGHVVNGRFKGGWTTRHYGRPQDGVHAIQMELAQSTHLATEAPPFDYDPAKADALRVTLKAILTKLAALGPELKA